MIIDNFRNIPGITKKIAKRQHYLYVNKYQKKEKKFRQVLQFYTTFVVILLHLSNNCYVCLWLFMFAFEKNAQICTELNNKISL